MTAAVDTGLDAETIAELEAIERPGCDWDGPNPQQPEQCASPATYAIRYQMRCGCSGIALLCTGHTRLLIRNLSRWVCKACGYAGPPVVVHWDLL